eukprot:CAMPEP_0202489354 /NCGR_PEP_ID=MMETSP1361-20130828/7099_1 /ASSEMBLY_ACC=CAM_ASM_000849 /TAXON_ID=210615 /ORGANISM="Staurosira complex sp., Strain CCMP2646" /LENGTH=418 /DNA_ID=CAMNT_0049119079 /DNA_START=90 /DNA_END=1349 /DNA_ORIENTATION=+
MAPKTPVIKTEDDVIMEEPCNNDEIVREIDVLLSPAMASHLYLMQFPLRPQCQVAAATLPDAARIKKDHGMIELDERIPLNAGRNGNFALDQRTFVSQTIPVSTHLAVGQMDDFGNAIHLVPLSHIVQMRPNFAHVNEMHNANSGIDPFEDATEEERLEKKPVMFQKKETERAAIIRKSSFAYKKASEESESWKMLVVCGPDTIPYHQAKESLTCASPSLPLVSTDATRNQNASSFVHSLNYIPPPLFDVDNISSTSNLSTVCAKLTFLLQRGWPVPYAVVQTQFPNTDDPDLLTALASCAVLVRGNFVLQSRLMPLTPALQQARTFVLLLLQKRGHVERVRLEQVFDENEAVTSEAIQMLLEQVATRGTNGWQPKLQDNLGLYELFPEQAQLHSQYWERQETRFAHFLQMYKEATVS